MYSPILSIIRILPLFIWTFFCASMQFIFLLFGKKTVFIFYRLFFAGLVKIFGIKLSISGKIKKENVLYVSNHVSYIDIFLLGSLLDAFFVAKSEISKWPFISTLCRLGKTIFIDRESRFKAKNQVSIIKNNLKKGNNIILFPEGTSSDGKKVLPFKSSLLGTVEIDPRKNFFLQPVSITYIKLDGIPVDNKFRPFFAWFGKMDLIPHAWKFLGLGLSEVKITFHEEKEFSSFLNRKEATKYSFDCIASQVAENYKSVEVESKIKLYEFKYL